jgi:hypothetical protein
MATMALSVMVIDGHNGTVDSRFLFKNPLLWWLPVSTGLDPVGVDRSVVQSARRRLLAYLYRFWLHWHWRLTPVVHIAGSTGLLSALVLLFNSFGYRVDLGIPRTPTFSSSFKLPSGNALSSSANHGTPAVHSWLCPCPVQLSMVILTLSTLVVLTDGHNGTVLIPRPLPAHS